MVRSLGVALGSILVGLGASPSPVKSTEPDPFGPSFWNHWGDGSAEVSTYDLTFPRYGELREGSAVAVFVTETFSDELRVKADPGRHDASDEFPVLKLNLVQDFPTGVYDYNLMTSAFLSLAPHEGRPAGTPAKVSFSSQEWCGHVYQQLLPGSDSIEHQSHSYFDGEADVRETLEFPENGFLEDAVFHWARGLARPFLEPGESRKVRVLLSQETSRLRHVPLRWSSGSLGRPRDTQVLEVPAGTFEVERVTVAIDGQPSWTFYVESVSPRRIVRWERDDGRRALLVASERLKYWEMNGNRFEHSGLESLGFSPRPARTP